MNIGANLKQLSTGSDRDQWIISIKTLINQNEDFLMQRMQHYAIDRGYSRYTSILKEAWRLSINGLSASFVTALEHISNGDLELNPDEDYTKDPAAAFGILEATRHRKRGVSLDMFLGLLKYYRQTYLDLFYAKQQLLGESLKAQNLLNRFFDRLEIGFCTEWATSKSQHEEELQQNNRLMTNEKNRYLILFESLPHPVILLNADQKVENLNNAAARLFDCQTTPGAHYYHADPDSPIDANINETLEVKLKKSSIVHFFNSIEPQVKDFIASELVEQDFEKSISIKGKELSLEIRLAKFLDFVGRLKSIIVFVQDLTEKKAAEAEQNRIRSQLLQSDKMACIGQLAAGVAHEINNPIGFVSSNLNSLNEYMNDLISLLKNYQEFGSNLLKDQAASQLPANLNTQLEQIKAREADIDLEFVVDDITELICESVEGTDRIRHIVSDLKDFAHPGEDRPKWTDLNRCLLSTANVVRNEIKYKAELKKDLKELPQVYCIAGKLNQVFMNLIVNAAHAIEKDGKIEITTLNANDHVIITISDNGSGIPADLCHRIFDPFFTTKPIGSGTGLGLHISKEIIEKHQGNICVESTPGKGTKFIITLPIEPNFDQNPDADQCLGTV